MLHTKGTFVVLYSTSPSQRGTNFLTILFTQKLRRENFYARPCFLLEFDGICKIKYLYF